MTGTSLLRLGGLAAVLAGALMAVDVLAHLAVDDTLEPASLAGLPHELWHVPGIVALPLALLGLVAIHVRGRPGPPAVGRLLIGAALLAAANQVCAPGQLLARPGRGRVRLGGIASRRRPDPRTAV